MVRMVGMMFRWVLALVLCFCSGLLYAQMAQKPSYYDQKRQAPLSYTDLSSVTPVSGGVLWQHSVGELEGFRQLARVYHQGTPFEIPHVLFVVDLEDGERVYFLNTPYFKLHENFVRDLLGWSLSRAQVNENYEKPGRRFIFGTLSWQSAIEGYTYEFWEGDKLTPQLLGVAQRRVNESFFVPVRFKSNSTWHEEVAKGSGIDYVSQHELVREQNFMTLSTGSAWGRLVVIRSEEDWAGVRENDIVLLSDVPISIPPVAGVITEKPSTVLSHVNVLANSWRIPNVYLKDAQRILAPLVGQQVKFTAYLDNYHIELAEEGGQVAAAPVVRAELPRPDVRDFRIKPLSILGVKDSVYCGAKAANLGAIKNGIQTVVVPDGFCIPFAYYDQFLCSHGLGEVLAEMEGRPHFWENSLVRKRALEELREMMMGWELDPQLLEKVLVQWRGQLKGQGVFVRSSSNSEDLPHFSGAGLYTTIPNVKTAEALEDAIKRSWASVFNFEAYEARRVAGFSSDSVMMSVFVQVAVDAEASGVMITRNPFDATKPYMTYIAAKRGLGIRVVEGRRVAEQVMYSSYSQAVQVLTSSDEETALQLDDDGGVKEVPLDGGLRVLTDELVVRLALEGDRIKFLLRPGEQDIEWAIKDGRIIILQARPYL